MLPSRQKKILTYCKPTYLLSDLSDNSFLADLFLLFFYLVGVFITENVKFSEIINQPFFSRFICVKGACG